MSLLCAFVIFFFAAIKSHFTSERIINNIVETICFYFFLRFTLGRCKQFNCVQLLKLINFRIVVETLSAEAILSGGANRKQSSDELKIQRCRDRCEQKHEVVPKMILSELCKPLIKCDIGMNGTFCVFFYLCWVSFLFSIYIMCDWNKFCREKKWVTIGDTTMKIYKWVPISSSEQKKKHLKTAASVLTNDNKENSKSASSALEMSTVGGNQSHNFGLTTEDSNTCFSMVSDSQGGTEFVSSGPPFSEDSNSQGSDGPSPAKRMLTK